jgi:hypothetical protein
VATGARNEQPAAVDALENAAAALIACVEELPPPLFIAPMNGWSPHDVVAHLVGWNRLTVAGCEDVLRGEPPAYLDDVDDDFRHVNAKLVREHGETDREPLLETFRRTAAETAAYARALDADAWRANVRFRRQTISVADCFDGLRQDYETHRQRIEAWASDRRGRRDP